MAVLLISKDHDRALFQYAFTGRNALPEISQLSADRAVRDLARASSAPIGLGPKARVQGIRRPDREDVRGTLLDSRVV